ncbi:MAG: Gfo/Idh/MocA family oxidoreductase [Aggregatilineales bacterium]
MAEKIGWGIIGTGNIAHQFAKGLKAVDDAELVAVGSRSQESADEFGDEFDVPNRHATYEALAGDPDVDAVYISTPHPMHIHNAVLCIEAGKAVLVEKPFTVNAADAKRILDAGRNNGVFVMEAVWTRFLPAHMKIKELVAEGAIGEVRMVQVDFGFRTQLEPEHRLFAPELAGGALLDVGVYPINMAWMMLGEPQSIVSAGDIGQTGVDEQAAFIFTYPQGELAVLSCAIRTDTRHEATIYGTEGRIHIPRHWWKAEKFTMQRGADVQEFEFPFDGNGYEYEAREVGRCLREGVLESPIMPQEDSLNIMRAMDTIRAQWGLTYPME